ncbi:MAG: hypothetical protein R3B07_15330 [Polyangiaceae bacterium]
MNYLDRSHMQLAAIALCLSASAVGCVVPNNEDPASGGAAGHAGTNAGGAAGAGAGGGGASGAAGTAGVGGGGATSGGATAGGTGGAGTGGSGAGGTGGTGGGVPPCPEYNPGDATHHGYGAAVGRQNYYDDETWSAGHTYFVMGSADFQSCTLTIEAGARVCLGEGDASPAILSMAGDSTKPGKLIINGTVESPVIFSSMAPGERYTGISLNSWSQSDLNNVRIVGGGTNGLGVIRVAQDHGALVARNVSIEDFAEAALVMRNPAGLSPDSSLSISSRRAGGTEPIADVAPAAISSLTPSNLKIESTIDDQFRRIRLADGYISKSLTLSPDLGADFATKGSVEVRRTSSSDPIAVLTLEAGTRVHFDGGELVVGTPSSTDVDGSLVAKGTAGNPVVLTSADQNPAPGQWAGLVFQVRSMGPETDVAYLRVENAGEDSGTSIQWCQDTVAGAIRMRGGLSASYAGPPMQNVMIASSAGDGLAFSCGSGACLTTDYSGAVSGTDIAGKLLRPLTCP